MWLVVLPVFSAFVGWLFSRIAASYVFRPAVPVHFFGLTFQGILPKSQPLIADKIANHFPVDVIDLEKIIVNVTDASNLEKIRPVLDEHMNFFLRVKLKESMPVVGSLIGDRTINQLKELFMNELELLFPSVMQHYLKDLHEYLDVKRIIKDTLVRMPPAKMETLMKEVLAGGLRSFQKFGALLGFFIGLIQVVFTLIFRG